MPELRPYQRDMLEAARQAYREGYHRPCLVLGCGGGKSVIVAEMARAVENEGPVRLGYLIIRARELSTEPEKLAHDKRTVSKNAVRVEIQTEEPETVEEPEPEPTLRYLGNWKVTGYDICMKCCGNTNGVTASGTQATVGRTCAAGKDLPFGTVLWIDGIGYRTVEDRGGGVNGGHIDVLCNDHSECYALTGHYDVYVVEG